MAEGTIPLSSLKTHPIRRKRSSVRTWLFSVSLSLCALIFIPIGIFGTEFSDARLIGWGVGSPALILALLVARKAYLESYDWLIFENREDGTWEVVLFYEYPSPDEFSFFVAELQRRIAAASTTPWSRQSPLGQALGELEDFHKRGTLTDEEFATAKRKVIQNFTPGDGSSGSSQIP